MKPAAWSNSAYLIAGLALYQVPAIAIFTALLGVFSFMAHHRGVKWWAADWAGMYLVFSAIALHHCGISPWLAIIPAGIGFRYGVGNYIAFGIVWVLAMASAQYAGISIIIPAIIFAAALACQINAGRHGSARYNILHSAWHILAAIAIYLIVRG